MKILQCYVCYFGVFSVIDKAAFLYETLKSHEEPTHIRHHNRNDECTNTVVHCICFLAKASNKQALLGIQHFSSEHIRLWRVHWSCDVHVNNSKYMVCQLFLNGLLHYLYLDDTAYSPTHIHKIRSFSYLLSFSTSHIFHRHFHRHRGMITITPVSVKNPKIWIDRAYELTRHSWHNHN